MIVWMLVLLWGCSADHYADKGKRALDDHELAAAEGHYRAALSRDTQHIGALSGLGWVYLLAGQKDAALSAFKLCIQVSPEAVHCLRGRAGVASAVGKPAEAREWLEKALLIAPFDGGVQSSLALLDLAAGNVPAALERYGQLVGRFPDASEYRLGLAEAHLRNKDYTTALSVIESGLDVEGGPARTRAMLLQTQARTLISASGKRVDAARCAETAPAVLKWLDAAEQAVALAEASGVELPDLPTVRRRLKRQQVRVANLCPK
jgi:tetratricopeptide (TPR) repeat protein